MQCQQFRQGGRIVRLEVQGDSSFYYNAMDDIIERFPDAVRFRVGDDDIVFLKDKDGNRYDPNRIKYYPDQTVDVISNQDSYSPQDLPSPPSSTGSLNIGVYNIDEPILSSGSSSIVSPTGTLNGGVHNTHHRNLSASSTGTLNVGVYNTHHRNLSGSSIASTTGYLNTGVYNNHQRNLSTSSIANFHISPPQLSRSRSPSTSESLPSPLSFPSSPSSSSSIPFEFRSVSPADKGMMSLRSPPDSFKSDRSSPFPYRPEYDEHSEYSEYSESDSPLPMAYYSVTRNVHEKQSISISDMMEAVNRFKNEIIHEVRVASSNVSSKVDIVIDEQVDSKRLQEERHRQILDRFKMVQRRVDAALTLNFELHEYPIPRLFVILPEKKRDKNGKSFFDIIKTKNLIQEKFRLHFLCECGEQTCGDNYNVDMSESGNMDENNPGRIHLADHEGYEISRPTKFFEQYGPYVLGVLRALQVCVGAASIIAPALVHVQTSLDSMARVTETVTKNTLDAVNMSIDYLQANLSQDALSESFEPNSENPEMSANGLKALEGADLRRLDTFLRNKDQDKILGKLYRVATSKGHVKWVCLKHYKYSYKAMAMASFIEMVKSYSGVYDQYLCKVTIMLPNSDAANEFIERLDSDGANINELDLTLKWVFSTHDLQRIVRAICRSNIKFLKVDLSDRKTRLDPKQTENRYRPLIDLFSNKDLQTLSLQGIMSFGYRTGDLPSFFQSSSLRTYQHLNGIGAKDTSKIAHILSLCPKLVDLRLGSELASIIDDELSKAIGSLTKLEVLHLWNFKTRDDHPVKGLLSNVIKGTKYLRELVVINTPVDSLELQAVVENFSRTLEVLILDPIYSEFNLATIIPKQSAQSASKPAPVPPSKTGWRDSTQQRPAHQATPYTAPPFSKLRQLHLNTDLSEDSSLSLALIMPRLSLTHFGLYKNIPMDNVISATDFSTVRSVYFCKFTGADLIPMWKSFPEFGGSNKIESISLERVRSPGTRLVRDCFAKIAIKRLWIGGVKSSYLRELFLTMNLSKLEVLAIVNCEYTWDVEAILARRHVDISDKLRVFVACNNQCSDSGDPNTYKANARNDDSDCYARLRPHQVWTDTSVNDMNLRHKLMVRME